MAYNKKDITTEELPEPISDQDMLLHNIIDGTPDISDLEPNSRQEVYLKYIALNGGSGGGGGGEGSVTISQTTGQSTTSVMSQKAVTDNLNNKVDAVEGKGLSTEDFTTEEKEKLSSIPDEIPEVTIVQTTGDSETDVMSQKAVSENTRFGVGASATGTYAAAFGDGAQATSNSCSSFGTSSRATNSYCSSFGNAAQATGAYCSAFGNGTQAIGNSCSSFGNAAQAAGAYSLALGRGSYSNSISQYSVALGSYSRATEVSTVSVGDGSTNANYGTRRIVNVKNPVNAQDAATKNYVDTKVSESGSGVNVVQETGESEEDIMSQKAVTDALTSKVDAVEGKGLSTEDFTTEYKEKLASIPDEIPDITVVQTTGTSTTNVMSQKAVSQNNCFGYGAKATSDTSVAFGWSAQATLNGNYSVALGSYSTATEPSVVSVGDGGTNANYGTRRIINVKDPVNDQDAATKKYVDDKVAESGGSDITVVQTTGTSETDVMSQKAVSQNTCFGIDASSTHTSSIVIGGGASTTYTNSIVIGEGASGSTANAIAIGMNTIANGVDSIAIGTVSRPTGLNAIAIGASSKATGGSAASFGYEANASGDYTLACGLYAKTYSSNSSALGRDSYAGVNSEYSVALGAYSRATEPSVVSVGYGSTNANYGTRRIVNVGDPINAQDAVTKNYLDGDILYSADNNTFADGLKTGTATLSQDISNYQYIEVSAVSSDGDFKNEKIYTGGLSSLRSAVNIIAYSETQMRYYYKMTKFTISNEVFEIVSQEQHRISYDASNNLNTSDCLNYPDTNSFAITRVVGYK